MEYWFGFCPQTDSFCSQTAKNPLFQVSPIRRRELNALSHVSTVSYGEKECSLESPVVGWGLPNSRNCANEYAHKALKLILSGEP